MKIENAKNKELLNSRSLRGLTMLNASGDVDQSTFGYDYAIRTTSFIRTQVIAQKFYEIPFADFVDVEVGTGAWMEDIQQNLVYDVAGEFEDGIQNVGAANTTMAMVDTGLTSKKATIVTWGKGYRWAISEVEKAFSIRFKLKDLNKMKNVGDMIDIIIQKL